MNLFYCIIYLDVALKGVFCYSTGEILKHLVGQNMLVNAKADDLSGLSRCHHSMNKAFLSIGSYNAIPIRNPPMKPVVTTMFFFTNTLDWKKKKENMVGFQSYMHAMYKIYENAVEC